MRERWPVVLGGAALVGLLLVAAAPAKADAVSPRATLPPHPPLPGTPRLSSRYGWRTDPIDGRRAFHRGLDIPVPTGTAVYAPYDGVVARVERDGVGRGATSGNAVVLEAAGWRWSFAHLSSVVVRAGDHVARGAVLGFSGATGRATGPHLHLQVADGAGETVDPETIYPRGTFQPRAAA